LAKYSDALTSLIADTCVIAKVSLPHCHFLGHSVLSPVQPDFAYLLLQWPLGKQTALDENGVSAYKPIRKFDSLADMDGCAF
jgi:hypothetical protein